MYIPAVGKQMFTLKLKPKQANLAHVRRKLNLSAEEIDHDFGVVNIDPKQDLYAVLVEEKAAQKAGAQPEVQGPFSNPRIETFGPPKKDK
jgi:hypothetical protein